MKKQYSLLRALLCTMCLIGAEANATEMNDTIVNPSFETGDMTGWVYGSIGGDHGAKPNSGDYETSGVDGEYLFNSWYSSDTYKATTQNQCAYQTIEDVEPGEYVLSILLSSNAYQNANTPVTLFANNFTLNVVPQHKGTLEEYQLEKIYVTEDVRSLTVGVRSACWFRADNMRLTRLGETEDYLAYKGSALDKATLGRPLVIDTHDGQKTEAFTYEKTGSTSHGGYPVQTGGEQKDRTMVDRSLMQLWTSSSYSLSNCRVTTAYKDLPNGYYRISSEVRVYDQNGGYDGTVKGLKLIANEDANAITTGTAIAKGNLSGKGFSGKYSVITEVKDGTLTAGFDVNGANFNWLGWQHFVVEYIGKDDPKAQLVNLDLPAETFVPLCLPYELKASYFGQTYVVAQVQNGVATLIPVESVPLGQPCVVYSTGETPNVEVSELTVDYDTPAPKLTLWDNIVMQGNYTNKSWTGKRVDGTTFTAKSLTYEVADLANMNFTATQMNRAADAFWTQNKSYSASSSSTISSYLSELAYTRRDQPQPIVIPVVKKSTSQKMTLSTRSDLSEAMTITVPAGATYAEAYNLMPGLTYYYKTADGKSQGQFTVGGALRMIYVGDHAYNVRDLGGKKTSSGKYVKYGRIFRSGEFNGGYVATAEELQTMRQLGVGAEVDLRNMDNGSGTSAWGFTEEDGTYYSVGTDHYIGDYPAAIDDEEAHQHWKAEFQMILANLREMRGVDFHCRIGADRTGMLAFLLEGLLGVTEADMLRDYETTSFSTAAGTRVKGSSGFDNLMKKFKEMIPSGGNLRSAFNTFFIQTLGVKTTEINEFRNLMLSSDPCEDADMIAQQSSLDVLRDAIRGADKYPIGEGLSEYTVVDQEKMDALNGTLAAANDYLKGKTYDSTTTNEHVKAINAAVTALGTALSLNMPQEGQFMTLRGASYGAYISCAAEADNQGYTRWPMVKEVNNYCIFRYDGERFVNCMTGLAFSADPIEYGNGIGDRSNMTAVEADGACTITVKKSVKGTMAAYNLYTPNAVLLLKKAGNNLDGFSTWLEHTDADVIMQLVDEFDAIDSVREEPASTLLYDLSGRRINRNAQRGIYIKGGKKIIR